MEIKNYNISLRLPGAGADTQDLEISFSRSGTCTGVSYQFVGTDTKGNEVCLCGAFTKPDLEDLIEHLQFIHDAIPDEILPF